MRRERLIAAVAVAAAGFTITGTGPVDRGQQIEQLLPRHRIVAFYGNPRAPRMGVLGSLAPDRLRERLESQARAYARADPRTPVVPALHLVTVVAQREPGADRMYRSRMPDSLIERLSQFAERHGWLLFLDVQPGRSRAIDEVRRLSKHLQHAWVHVAIDPEFAMSAGQVPGSVIGSLDAREIALVVDYLAETVETRRLPAKILVVHRFTDRMVKDSERIALDPRVQIVIDMDGFGRPGLKRDSYAAFIAARPVQFAGFKLFYDLDSPLMAPEEVLRLKPPPLFILYQ